MKPGITTGLDRANYSCAPTCPEEGVDWASNGSEDSQAEQQGSPVEVTVPEVALRQSLPGLQAAEIWGLRQRKNIHDMHMCALSEIIFHYNLKQRQNWVPAASQGRKNVEAGQVAEKRDLPH